MWRKLFDYYYRLEAQMVSGVILGATALEYALLIALIAVAVIAAITAFGGAISNIFTNITLRLQGIPQ